MTFTELKEASAELQKDIFSGWKCLHPEKIAVEISELKSQTEDPKFWDNPDEAQKTSRRLAALQKKEKLWKGMVSDIQGVLELLDMTGEGSAETAEIESEFQKVKAAYEKAEVELYLSGEYDNRGAIMEITAGAGGTEAQDWAEILLRMELRFCERMEWETEILEKSEGSEAGIKSVTFEVQGENAFGYLQGEKGTHRLVRQSPFNAKNLRQTSFAGVVVSPLLEEVDLEDILIEDKDLRIDTFRAQGAGGQHVNKTDSAIRITHIPSGIVVSCQNQRSQHQNREKALQILKSRLAEQKRLEEEEKQARLRGEHVSAEWGSQIRNYVLHPYKLVKDLRTDYESSHPDSVLDGDLEGFAQKYLEWKAQQSHVK
jgi:peptide chain release factor 2